MRIFFHVIFSWAHLANILAWRARISRILGWNFSCCWCTMGILLPNWANWGGGPSREGTLLALGDIFIRVVLDPQKGSRRISWTLHWDSHKHVCLLGKTRVNWGEVEIERSSSSMRSAATAESELILRGCVSLPDNVPESKAIFYWNQGNSAHPTWLAALSVLISGALNNDYTYVGKSSNSRLRTKTTPVFALQLQ